MTVTGSDPVLILTGPISSTTKAIDRSGLSIDDVDLFECHGPSRRGHRLVAGDGGVARED
ncbi:MAG: hypothetical protein ACRD0A_13795 [Acidimicrobiales bacterium]